MRIIYTWLSVDRRRIEKRHKRGDGALHVVSSGYQHSCGDVTRSSSNLGGASVR